MRFSPYLWLAAWLLSHPVAFATSGGIPTTAGGTLSEGRDAYEQFVPTPAEPPDGIWRPGDRVRFIRRGTDGQHEFTRETVYERQADPRWGVSENRVTKVPCKGKCPESR